MVIELDVTCIAWLARISSDNEVVKMAYMLIRDRGLLGRPFSDEWYDCLNEAEGSMG